MEVGEDVNSFTGGSDPGWEIYPSCERERPTLVLATRGHHSTFRDRVIVLTVSETGYAR